MDRDLPGEADRRALAGILQDQVTSRFRGLDKLAYQEAGVNPATWSRLVKAQTVKRHTLVGVVSQLWPETGGDWRKVPGLRPSAQDVLDLAERADITPRALAAIRRALQMAVRSGTA